MAFVFFILSLLTHAAPQCVDLFDVSVKTATQEEYLKNYLALNTAFPQHRSTISVGLTAFYFARGMSQDLIDKPFTPQQQTLVYQAMIKAHGAVGVSLDVPFEDSQLALSSFTTTLPIQVEKTLSWVDAYLGGRDSPKAMARLYEYSQTVILALRSSEARDFSHRFRAGFKEKGDRSAVPTLSREQIYEKMRNLLIQKLEEAHPELSNVDPRQSQKTLAELLYEALN